MEFHRILSITESHEPQKQQSRPVSCCADGNLHPKGMVGGAGTSTLREGLPSWRGGHTEAAAEADGAGVLGRNPPALQAAGAFHWPNAIQESPGQGQLLSTERTRNGVCQTSSW